MKSEHIPDNPALGPQLDNIQWVYHSSYYDGPISGMVRLEDGTVLWAQMIEQCDCYDEKTDEADQCGFYRRYQLYRLSPEQTAVEAERHADFQKYVGVHTDYTDGKRTHIGNTQPQIEWYRFYEKWSPRDSEVLVGAEPVGWWER
ncbi:MAG: hypothetical protein WC054_00685 [Candidatus Nanopelagicales bacterium]